MGALNHSLRLTLEEGPVGRARWDFERTLLNDDDPEEMSIGRRQYMRHKASRH